MREFERERAAPARPVAQDGDVAEHTAQGDGGLDNVGIRAFERHLRDLAPPPGKVADDRADIDIWRVDDDVAASCHDAVIAAAVIVMPRSCFCAV